MTDASNRTGISSIRISPVQEDVFQLRLDFYEGSQHEPIEVQLAPADLMALYVALRAFQAQHGTPIPATNLPKSNPVKLRDINSEKT